MPRIRKSQESRVTSNRRVWRIGVYIRLSRDDGNDESLSVTNQRKIILEYLERSFEEEYAVVDIYIDDGKTGTDYERPDFQRMIGDVEAGKINCIVCKTLARAFRNYSDQGYFLEKVFPIYGTRFISIGSPALDTYLNPDAIIDGMEVPITGLMNDRYAARTSKDIRRTFDMKRRNGEFIGSFAPYGYAKDPENKNALVVDEEAAQIVRDIFHWYVDDGMTKCGIVRHLNDLGVLPPATYMHNKGIKLYNPKCMKCDGMWNLTTVKSMLQNQVYIGNMVQGKRRTISYKVHKIVDVPEEEWFIIENTHEPIIDKAVFEKAQDISKRTTRAAPDRNHVHLFSGLLRCADCNATMRRHLNGKVNANGEKRAYFICNTYAVKSRTKCNSHRIRHEKLVEAVLKAIQVQISLVGDMAEIISQINSQPNVCNKSVRLEKQIADKRRELEKIICVTDNLYMDWKCGDITRGEYMRMKANFEAQAEHTRQVIANIEMEMQIISNGIGDDDPYLKTFLKHENITELNRGLLVELVDTIYIHENHEITIQFKFADQHKRMLEFIEDNRQSAISNEEAV